MKLKLTMRFAIWTTVLASALSAGFAFADASVVESSSAQNQITPPVIPKAEIDTNHCVKPAYPVVSVYSGESGLSKLKFFIDIDGTVIDAVVKESSGYPRLDEAALNALRLCKFKPAIKDDVAIKSWAHIEYQWRLDDWHGWPAMVFAYDNEKSTANVPSRNGWFSIMGKPYDRLPAEHRNRFNALYDTLKIGDEPPYPEKGLGALYFPIAQAQSKRNTMGVLSMHVNVGADGNAISVSVLASPDKVIKEIAARAVMNIKFKPAKCNGNPCIGIFPLRLVFSNGYTSPH